jgi:hypothetical protein
MSHVSATVIELDSFQHPAAILSRSELPVGGNGDENNTLGSHTTEFHQLKPVDGGRAAWTVLVAGFIFEALLWGT